MEPKSSEIQVAFNYIHLYLVVSLLLVQFGKGCFLLTGAPLYNTKIKKQQHSSSAWLKVDFLFCSKNGRG